MNNSPLARYKIGLGAIAFFTLILLVVLLSQAGGTKKDAQTYDKANSIATKLNDYTDSNQSVPANLSAAGVKDVPATISYKKLSDTSYKFCVTYQTKSADFNAADVESNLLTEGEDTAQLGNATSASTDNSYLSVSSSHNKGQHCQTITPVIVNDGGTEQTDPNDPYAKCDSITDGTAYNQCVDSVDGTQSSTNDNSSSTDTSTSQGEFTKCENIVGDYNKWLDCVNTNYGSQNSTDANGNSTLSQ